MTLEFTTTTVENVIKLVASMRGGWYNDESDIITIECVRIKGWRRNTNHKVYVVVDYRNKENKMIKVKYHDETFNMCWTNNEINIDNIKASIDFTVNNYNV
jgi:hypothetical protein